MTTSRNIKDRINRKNVCKLLKSLSEKLSCKKFTKGIIIFAGIDEFGEEIFEFIEPNLCVNIFYYNCGGKFNTDILGNFMQECAGNIILANGNECIIYEFINGGFMKKAHINACLQKRQKHGGQSANRIMRLAEETRHMYVTKVIDTLNSFDRSNKMFLFGSKEICSMIHNHSQKLVCIDDGGFLDFNNRTINNTEFFVNKLKDVPVFNKYYEKIVLYLDTDVDMLDFDIEKRDEMEFYISNNYKSDKSIPLPENNNPFHAQLCGFEYVGIKYYAINEVM